MEAAVSAELTIVIPGPPRAWQRAVVANGRTLTPRTMRAHKQHAVVCMRAAALASRWEMATGPVRLEIDCYRRRLATAVPDGDNYSKLHCDAGNGILWRDDAQVVELTVRKHDVRVVGGEERTEVVVAVLG
jgi:Holliday junction resolvase RusA-like endonuclease